MNGNEYIFVIFISKIYAHRESNPSLILGREAFYHYTMCASLCN